MQIYCFASTFVCLIFWTFLKGVPSHRKHSFLKSINQGKNGNKYNITTYRGHDYEAFEELDRGFDQIEEQPFTNSKSGPNYQGVNKQRECQENSLNVWSEHRIGPEEIAGVLSSSACSRECSSRPSCSHWIWHSPAAAGFAHLCVTITGFRQKNYDGGTIFGDRGCLAGTRERTPARGDSEFFQCLKIVAPTQ